MKRSRKDIWNPRQPQRQLPPDGASPEAWLEDRLLKGKPLWRESDRRLWRFYCPCCGVTRNLKTAPRPGVRHVFQVALTTALLSVLCWPLFGMKGLLLFIPLWAAFEGVFRLRVRAELACDECGFDPTLYLANTRLARREMETFWKTRADSGRIASGAVEGVTPESAPVAASGDSVQPENPVLTVEKA